MPDQGTIRRLGAETARQEAVGVVVVSHRSAAELGACLDGLLRAAAVAAVVVVDNASQDGSVEAARAVHDPRVTVLALPENLGFAGGCNRGLAALPQELEWVACANPDVVVEPDCLARCAERLRGSPQVASVAPRLMRPDGATVDSVGQVLRRPTLEVHDRGYGRPLSAQLARPARVLAACGALAVFRRSALDAVAGSQGPFAQHYFCFWEDLELGWRLTNRGWTVLSEPEAVAVHGRGAGAAAGRGPLRWRRPVQLEACVISNRWMTLIRHLHPLDLAALAPLLLVWDLALVATGVARRPALAGHLRSRWSLVRREWTDRGAIPRRRLRELPW